jgi:hypothetical protein
MEYLVLGVGSGTYFMADMIYDMPIYVFIAPFYIVHFYHIFILYKQIRMIRKYRKLLRIGPTNMEAMEIKSFIRIFVLQNKMLVYNLYGLFVVLVVGSFLKWYAEIDEIRIYGGLVMCYIVIMAVIYSLIACMYIGMRQLNRDYKSYSCSISSVME